MFEVPEILDIQNDLNRAKETSEQDIDKDIESVLDIIRSYEDREYGDRQGLLDRLDEELLRLEEQVESDHTRLHVQAARNRVRIYRDAMSDLTTDLGVITTKLNTADTEDQATLRVTVVNEGEPTIVDVTTTFYDEEIGEIKSIRSEPIECDANTETTISLDIVLPDDYAYHVPAVKERN